jgi:hypothetical protein
MWSELAEHWERIMAIGLTGGTLAVLPRLWRAFVRVLAAPALYEIERERRLAREQQVLDLTQEIERLKRAAHAVKESSP